MHLSTMHKHNYIKSLIVRTLFTCTDTCILTSFYTCKYNYVNSIAIYVLCSYLLFCSALKYLI